MIIINKVKLMATCSFGIESILKKEILSLGYEIIKVEDGRIIFETDLLGICRSNIWLRTAERILLIFDPFKAETFDELFEKVKVLPWYDYIPKNGRFPVVKAGSVNSALFSSSDIQAIVKKAVVKSMTSKYEINWFEEDGENYPIRIFIHKDMVYVGLDTSGAGLNKRGYRKLSGEAPLSETLAAALVYLSPWRKGRTLIDPFCGSGTILIEAAMQAKNIAPGLRRDFTSENWDFIDSSLWTKAYEEAEYSVNDECSFKIEGYDIDDQVLKTARHNAKLAGVDDYIHFQQRDMKDLASPKKYGFIITNPPYGERLSTSEEIKKLYKQMGKVFKTLDTWSFYILTSIENFEDLFEKKANKKRKLYNGMIKCNYNQFFGPRPPRK